MPGFVLSLSGHEVHYTLMRGATASAHHQDYFCVHNALHGVEDAYMSVSHHLSYQFYHELREKGDGCCITSVNSLLTLIVQASSD